MTKARKEGPTLIELDDGTVFYRCPECESEVEEDGESLSEPCYYCPDICKTCGRGFCDLSC